MFAPSWYAFAPAEMKARIMEQVMPVFRSEPENVKFVASLVLGEYGPMTRAATPDLPPMLGVTQFERNRAAKALGQIYKDAATALLPAWARLPRSARAAQCRPKHSGLHGTRDGLVDAGDLGGRDKFGQKAEMFIPFVKRFLTNPQFHGRSDGRLRELAVCEALKFLQGVGPRAVVGSWIRGIRTMPRTTPFR